MGKSLKAAFLLVGAAIFGSANAAFIKVDLFAPGDQLLIQDSNTQMEWVRLSVTEGVGVYNVMQGYKSLTTDLGFHLPSRDEILSLLANFNLPMRGDYIAADRLAALHFQELFGVTAYFASGALGSFGFIEQVGNPMTNGITAMSVGTNSSIGGAGWVDLGMRNNSYTNGHPDYGSYLTRPYVSSSVPEPGSLVLLCIGLVGLGMVGWSSRRRKQVEA